ncbi:hypothetical protein [Streptomyces sp. NPDC001388]|uniref:hypothetical protein n=1 Tax=Streptomyces sp. NPDC001388 TaxID=3364568 RepID=UPI00367F079A
MREVAAEGLGEVYFRDRGRRAQGLLVEFTDVEHVDFDLEPRRPAPHAHAPRPT